jgi:palmitoyltransferase ZDHHC9/14/18
LSGVYGFTSFIGLWCVSLFLMAWFSDPGVITPDDDTASAEAIIEYNSFDSDEQPYVERCPIYKNSPYYRNRDCSTCHIQRPSKASHCGTCGFCIRGWDHHCHAINNCVGRRNFRSFAMFLMLSTSWAVINVVASLSAALYLYPE